MSTATTRGVRVDVSTRYVPEQSEPPRRWLFAYQVTIRNEGDETVQLLTREWIITNGEGKEETVRGAGVVGHQPTLAPGEGFQYVSACPLDTPVGTMRGHYGMRTSEGDDFNAAVAAFTLVDPMAVN